MLNITGKLGSAVMTCLVLVSALICSGFREQEITIVVEQKERSAAGYVLACEDVADAIRSTGRKASARWLADDAALPDGNLILVGKGPDGNRSLWIPEKPQGYRIRPALTPERKILFVEGDEKGLMYGLFKLAERISVGEELWEVNIESSPTFKIRLFCEQGQMLDIPDIGYYIDEPPYVNEKILCEEINELKEMARHTVRMGYSTFGLLHLGVEEYIDYIYLDKEIYS